MARGLAFPHAAVAIQVRRRRRPLNGQKRWSTETSYAVTSLAASQATPAQVALAWLLSRPVVTAPIIGATRLGHISDALAAVQLTLTEEEVHRLEEAYLPHPVLGHS